MDLDVYQIDITRFGNQDEYHNFFVSAWDEAHALELAREYVRKTPYFGWPPIDDLDFRVACKLV